jgi:hypothetical protein
MKYLTATILLIALQSCLIGSGENSEIVTNGVNFPKIIGIDLQGKRQELPSAFEGRLNIVAVAFKREQQKDVDSWIVGVDEIIKNNSDINFYEVPLIYELGMVSRMWVNNGMRYGIPSEIARKRTITVYTNREKFFEIMKMKEDRIYVLVLDNSGKILWQIEGMADEDKITSMKNFVGSN